MGDLDLLVEMGFDREKSQQALKATGNAGLQPALDWLDKHPNGENTADDSKEDDEETDADASANSLKCDDCGKLLKNENSAQFHAVKTGHSNFSQSTEVVKPLTEEEKKAKMEELKIKLAEKRAKQAEIDKQEAKERERIRRLAGKDMLETKEKLKEKEMKAAIEQKKREAAEERAARERIKAQIEADRREKAEKLAEQKRIRAGLPLQSPNSTTPVSALSNSSRPGSASSYQEARIQIRIPGGKPAIVQSFPVDSKLEELFECLACDGYAKGSYTLMMTYPRKQISLADAGKTFKEMNLVPSAALILQ